MDTKVVVLAILGVGLLVYGAVMISLPTPAPIEQAYMYPQVNSGSSSKVEVITPAYTTYKGRGERTERSVDIARISSPFGNGAGEVLVAQKPVTLDKSTDPELKITPDGIGTEGGTAGKASTGGFSGSGIIASIWNFVKNNLWWGILLLGGGLVLYFLVPGAQPILSGIFRTIMSIFPFLGSLIEKMFGVAQTAAVTKQLQQAVAGGQAYKDAIERQDDLTPSQKNKLHNLFNEKQMIAQDEKTQKAIKAIKTNLNL